MNPCPKLSVVFYLFLLPAICGRSQNIVVDSVSIESHYLSECRLHVHQSLLPRASGFSNADVWNVRFLEFLDQRIAGNCEGEVQGELSEQGMSDTLSYLRCDFRELYQSELVLSMQCFAWFVPHGGNGWWLEHEIFNIDLTSGEPITLPENLLFQDNERLDAIICDHFELNGGCLEPYHCHSCSHQDFLQQTIAKRHVGIVEGQWTLLEMMWPQPCSHAAESMVLITLDADKADVFPDN